MLLGSMGVDIHWTSKGAAYVTPMAGVLLLCGVVVLGFRLRRDKD
jgi:hypothetical protein